MNLFGNDELYWELEMDLFGNARGKIAMDKPQSVRPQHYENDPLGNIVQNIADLYNLSADASFRRQSKQRQERGREKILERNSLLAFL